MSARAISRKKVPATFKTITVNGEVKVVPFMTRTELRIQRRQWKQAKFLKTLEKQKQREKKEKLAQNSARKKEKNDKILMEKQGRHYTVSIAVPGSILDNAQTNELKAYLTGQVARSAAVFCIDEIVVYDSNGSMVRENSEDDSGTSESMPYCNLKMARMLQYMECPQYLRKQTIPFHKDLEIAGLLPPLDCPHHLREHDKSEYREGCVLDKPLKQKGTPGSLVDVGLKKPVEIDKVLQPGLRVTVKMGDTQEGKPRKCEAVAPSAPRTMRGIYWGYDVRLASCLSAVFSEAPYEGGYDITIGTSENGTAIDNLELANFNHILIVFGGLEGIESALKSDKGLKISDPLLLFDHYINTCPNQGSRTIRTEEALLISLSALQPKITAANSKDFPQVSSAV